MESVDVRMAGEGGVTVIGVRIHTDKYVPERAMEVVGVGGTDHLARCPVSMPGKQAASLIAIESLEQRTRYLERALDTGLSLGSMQKGRQRGAVGVRDNPVATGRGRGTVYFPMKGARTIS